MLSCKHGCGYEHAHKGAMNIHENIHCPKIRSNSRSGSGAAAPFKNKKIKSCDHRFRILTAREEKYLVSKGVNQYDEICQECGELK